MSRIHSRLFAIQLTILAGGLCGVVGCKPTSTAPPGPAANSEDAAATGNDSSSRMPAGAESSIHVKVVDADGYQQVIDRHRGKVVLVDFWATWCVPCRKQFPHTVELSQQLADQGLVAVSMSMDDPSMESEVLQFLKEHNATFDNLLSKFGVGTESAEAFNVPGDVPFYKLYDRSGTLRYQFSADPEGIENGEPLSKIDERVKELLAEQ